MKNRHENAMARLCPVLLALAGCPEAGQWPARTSDGGWGSTGFPGVPGPDGGAPEAGTSGVPDATPCMACATLKTNCEKDTGCADRLHCLDECTGCFLHCVATCEVLSDPTYKGYVDCVRLECPAPEPLCEEVEVACDADPECAALRACAGANCGGVILEPYFECVQTKCPADTKAMDKFEAFLACFGTLCATVSPARRAGQASTRDYDGDGRDDVFWYRAGDESDPLWLGAANRVFVHGIAPNVQGTYRTTAGDFDGDGVADVLFHAKGTAPDAIWNGDGAGGFIQSKPKDLDGQEVNVQGDYEPLAGDFDGDGVDDVFWYAAGAAADSLWYGRGANRFESVDVAVNGTYLPVTGDFDGDDCTDILWFRHDEAPESVWYGCGGDGTFVETVSRTAVSPFFPFAGDFDGDGRDDIFWYAPGNTTEFIWLGQPDRGAFRRTFPLDEGGANVGVRGVYQAVPGDFDGDGKHDVLWYGAGDDPDFVWFNSGELRFASKPLTITGVYEPI